MEDMNRSIISVYKDNIVNNEGGTGNPHPDNNIILDYMNEKAKISNYSNQCLNDDSEQKRQINSIIDVLSDITNKLDINDELTHLTCYNLGFSLGILSQIASSKYEEQIKKIRIDLTNNNTNTNIQSISELISNLKTEFSI